MAKFVHKSTSIITTATERESAVFVYTDIPKPACEPVLGELVIIT